MLFGPSASKSSVFQSPLGARRAGVLVVAIGVAQSAVAALAVPVAVAAPAPTSGNVAEDAVLMSDLSTRFSNTFSLGNGSRRLDTSTIPVNYKDAEGDWEPIDTDLSPKPADMPDAVPGLERNEFAAATTNTGYTAGVPSDPEVTPAVVSLDSGAGGSRWITFKLHGLSGEPTIEADSATFSNVRGADSLVLEATAEGVKENIVLEEAPLSTGEPSPSLEYKYDIELSDGLRPRLASDRSIYIEEEGVASPAFVIPVGNMMDSAGADGGSTPGPAFTNDVDYEIVPRPGKGNSFQLTVTPDIDWLLDDARVFPVVIDPTITTTPARDCTLARAYTSTVRCGNTTTFLRAGHTNGIDTWRSVLGFPTLSLPSQAKLLFADLRLWLDSAETSTGYRATYSLHETSRRFSNTATWSTSGAYGSWSGGDPSNERISEKTIQGSVSGHRYFDVTPTVARWLDGSQPNPGLVLRQNSESTNHKIAFASSSTSNGADRRPLLSVVYSVDPPSSSADDESGSLTADDQTEGLSPEDEAFLDGLAGEEGFRLVFGDDESLTAPSVLEAPQDGPEPQPQPWTYGESDASAPDVVGGERRWYRCGEEDDTLDIVTYWSRNTFAPAYVGDYAFLNCGNDAFGLKHMRKGGKVDAWKRFARIVDRPWTQVAYRAAGRAMRFPKIVKRRPSDGGSDSFCHAATFSLKGPGVDREFSVRVVMGATARRIITLFASRPRALCGSNPRDEVIYPR